MPLIKRPSKKAFEHNIEAEMRAGKSQDQALAIAYAVKKKSKKMAEGGVVSASDESRPMPEAEHEDRHDIARSAAKKALLDSDWTDTDEIMEKKQRLTPIKHPKMADSILRTKLVGQEDDLMSQKPASPRQEPEEIYEEPKSQVTSKRPDMSRPHTKSLMAQGGIVHEMDDQPKPEEEIERAASLAAAIMAKRKYMAEGGMVNGKDSMRTTQSGQVNLRRNAEEDGNVEDQLSFDAARKENYNESEGLEDLDYDLDNQLHPDIGEDKHDMVSLIRKKMRMRE